VANESGLSDDTCEGILECETSYVIYSLPNEEAGNPCRG